MISATVTFRLTWIFGVGALTVGIARVASAQAPRTRDSAGVTMVENLLPGRPPVARRVDATPLLTLGSGDGGAAQQFGQVTGAVRLADGSIAVADGKNLEIRLFDARGRLLRRIGRKGEGPGDFQSITDLLHVPGDTLIAWDGRLNRLTWFTASGKAVRTLRVNPTPLITKPGIRGGGSATRMLIGHFADGTLLSQFADVRMIGPNEHHSEITNDSLTLALVAPDGTAPVIGRFFRAESYRYYTGPLMMGDARPFGRSSSIDNGPKEFYISDGAQFEFQQFTPAGKLLRIVRVNRHPLPVTARDIAHFRDSSIASLTGPDLKYLAGNKETLDWIAYPKAFPAYTALRVDANGNVWAHPYAAGPLEAPWDLFDPNGRFLGVVAVPNGSDVIEIGKDYILARFKDQDDVEDLRLFRIR